MRSNIFYYGRCLDCGPTRFGLSYSPTMIKLSYHGVSVPKDPCDKCGSNNTYWDWDFYEEGEIQIWKETELCQFI